MTIPRWPADLPNPEQNTFVQTLGDNRRMRQDTEGPPRPRRGWSLTADTQSLSIVVDRDGRAVFENFRIEQTERGALPFIMPDASTDSWPIATDDGSTLTTDDGTPLLLTADWLCLFSQKQPQIAIVGVQFRITFEVMVMP